MSGEDKKKGKHPIQVGEDVYKALGDVRTKLSRRKQFFGKSPSYNDAIKDVLKECGYL